MPLPSTAFQVTTSFTLGGSVSDYDQEAWASIVAALAIAANVAHGAVSLSITAGSVVITAEIAVASVAVATTTAQQLSDGILSDASSLDTALTAQFEADGVSTATLTVEQITAAPALVRTADTEELRGIEPPGPPPQMFSTLSPSPPRVAFTSPNGLTDSTTASEQRDGQSTSRRSRMTDTLHVWLPLSLLALLLVVSCCACYVQYVRSKEAEFSHMIQSAVEEGIVIRASALESADHSPRPADASPRAVDPRVAQSPKNVTLRTVEIEVPDEAPGSNWSLLVATKARLHLDRRVATESRARQRGEHARSFNRSRLSQRLATSRDATNENDVPAAGAPPWDEDPNTKQSVLERSPCVEKKAARSSGVVGSPRSGYRVRTTL